MENSYGNQQLQNKAGALTEVHEAGGRGRRGEKPGKVSWRRSRLNWFWGCSGKRALNGTTRASKAIG